MKILKKWITLCITGIIISSLAGCGRSGEINSTGDEKENAKTNAETLEKSMGRYLEEELAVPKIDGTPNYQPDFYMQRQDDGKLVLVDRFVGGYVSEDNGESWEKTEDSWDYLTENNYIMHVAFSPEGATALVCSPYEDEDESELSEEETAGNPEDAGGDFAAEAQNKEDAVEEPEEDAESAENSEIPLPEIIYYYIDPEGTVTEIPFQGSGNDFILHFEFDRQGRLYGYGTDGIAYRIDPGTGTAKELFGVEGTVEFVCFTGRYMVACTSRKAVVVYDLEQEITVEDKVLQDFVKENAGQSSDISDDGHSMIATEGEQADIIYLAVSDGLYRHVFGGTVMEQIIDGNMTMLGDPSAELLDMVMLPDNEFLVLYTGEKLCKYTYDPNVPTVPERQLHVYSLVENYSLRQAVSLFQKEHPDVYIRYEVGMSGEDSVTRDDAVRKLNTKIMAGEGPDILLLDGLPQTSYEEKGVLMDVSPVVDGMDGEAKLFPNVVDACRKDGKIYALPIRIQIPMMVGKKDDVEKIRDLNSLVDVIEAARAENPQGALFGLKSPEELLYVLSLTSSAAWMDEKGNINEKALEEFLTAADRIWQAELSGVDEEWLESETNYGARFSGEGMYYATASNQALNTVIEGQRIGLGKVYRIDFDYDTITSIAGLEDDFDYEVWNGQVENGFIPDGMAGVLANSAEDELVMEFYRFLFGRKLQDMDLSGGFPVNMASFDTFAVNPYEDPGMWDNFAGGFNILNDNGERFMINLIWPGEEEFGKLKEIVSGMSVVGRGDATIEEMTIEVGAEMLDGDMTVQEAVQEIVKRSAIYLAE
ncbi:MAG: carbohydrate ABC transporter substrate-binding protein [Lachnospiraceae bacterium]|nr:carbohydrate ABC transporter substrate-binding protein [Lachnospiraceae bacterium]